MKAIDPKKLLPVLSAVVVFIILSITYFSPVLEGKQLKQSDKTQWQGMSKEIQEHRELYGEEPLWTGSAFSGMPAYQVSVIWASNLLNKVHKVLTLGLPRPASFLFLYLLGMFFLLRVLKVDPWLSVVGAVAFAFSSYFFIILEAGHNSKANAIAYMAPTLASFILLYRGRVLTGAALFALFMGLEITMNHPQITYYLGFVLLFFALAEAVRAFNGGSVPGFLKRSGTGLVAVALAVMCNLGSLWSTYEYGKYTIRGKSDLTIGPDGTSAMPNKTAGLDRDYVTEWSYGIDESLTLLVPNAKGGESGSLIKEQSDFAKIKDPAVRSGVQKTYQEGSYVNAYWGDQRFTSGPVYLGAIVILLLLLSLTTLSKPQLYWSLAAIPIGILLPGFDSPTAAGIFTLLYILSGLATKPEPLHYSLWSALFLTLLLSWGRNFMPLTDFFLDVIPGYDKFRAVTIILVIVELAAPVLGIIYLDRLVKSGKWDASGMKLFLIPAGVLTAFLLFLWFVPQSLVDMLSEVERGKFNAQIDQNPAARSGVEAYAIGLKELRADVFRADVVRSLGFVIAAIALIWLFGKGLVNKTVLIAGLGVLILTDLWTVDKRYLNNDKEKGRYAQWEAKTEALNPHAPSKADLNILSEESSTATKNAATAYIAKLKAESDRPGRISPLEEQVAWFGALRRNTHFRVLNLNNPTNDARTSYFHKSLGGYHGAKLRRYQELFDFYLYNEVGSTIGALRSGGSYQSVNDAFAKNRIMNMLNAKYVIFDPDQPALKNLNALGPAWFVDEVRYVPSPDEEIRLVGNIEPDKTAVLNEADRSVIGEATIDPSATVKLEEYATDQMRYTTSSSKDGVVMFSEIWYGPDWQAYLDGVPVDHSRANFVLRAMKVPAGQHEIVFKLESTPFKLGSTVNLMASALLIVLALYALFKEYTRQDAMA
jgi:hypothetical protein